MSGFTVAGRRAGMSPAGRRAGMVAFGGGCVGGIGFMRCHPGTEG
ncbi:hypothetical protein [Mobiluncus mulieris]|nr:hypothetical protein [Mobiluncus mulieris]